MKEKYPDSPQAASVEKYLEYATGAAKNLK